MYDVLHLYEWELIGSDVCLDEHKTEFSCIGSLEMTSQLQNVDAVMNIYHGSCDIQSRPCAIFGLIL